MRIGKFFQVAALIMLAAGAQPAYSAFWQWSTTSANNASADPSINWAESMSPSSVNDSARAMMARAAEYRDDMAGTLVSTGTATAYVLATNQGTLPSPPNGQSIVFAPNVTNGVNPTITVDGGTAFPINQTFNTAVASGTLISGTPYRMTFRNGNQWLLQDFYVNPFSIPLGGLMAYTGTTTPNSNFVFAAGQCLSTTTYAAYWTFLGSPASGSCAGGQFRIIDISGRALAGLDTMPGFSAANRLTSSSGGCGTAMTSIGAVCANGVEGSTIPLAQLPTGIQSNGTFALSITNVLTNPNGGFNAFSAPSGATVFEAFSNGAIVNNNTGVTASGTVTSTNTSGATRPGVPPLIGVTYILRVI